MNYANEVSKVAKVYISDELRITTAVELLLNEPEDFKQILPRIMDNINHFMSRFAPDEE
jgi:hypothetical protein